MSTPRKIGFWAVVAIVVGSQIGSGIFLLPASLAVFGGGIGLSSWLVSGAGAIILALIFSELCRKFPQTGGPHVYVNQAFGRRTSFYIAWAYWVISWVSSPAVIVAAIGYIVSVIPGGLDKITILALEIWIVVFFMVINLQGVSTSGRVEFVLSTLKLLPVFVLPLLALPYVSAENFEPYNATSESNISALGAAALVTFWGFIGVECATTPAGSVKNPTRTIPLAITIGTIFVVLVYTFCTYAIMGVVENSILRSSQAPFSDVAKIALGGEWYYLVSIAGAVVCLGTLNAWILTSGQIALGAANDGLFPPILGKKNTNGVPKISIMISTLGMVPMFMVMILNDNLVEQFTMVIDASVTVFVMVYFMCCLSYFKLCISDIKSNFVGVFLSLVGLIFCGWVISSAGVLSFVLSFMVFVSAIPLDYYWFRKQRFAKI